VGGLRGFERLCSCGVAVYGRLELLATGTSSRLVVRVATVQSSPVQSSPVRCGQLESNSIFELAPVHTADAKHFTRASQQLCYSNKLQLEALLPFFIHTVKQIP
jgi:hypothetical protein